MATNHNRIKVADLEKNQPDKILTTNSSGELEFTDIGNITLESYNSLDYQQQGKTLDARQGKVLKDLIDKKVDKNFGLPNANKLLGTDENGNLKISPLPNFQAPFLGEVISHLLPQRTGDITITGAFFTPSMTVSIVGQTVNYITFINDNLIKVNVTTGPNDGNYAITLNNGISITFPSILSIVLGETYKPKTDQWEAPTGNISALNDSVKVNIYEVVGSNRWNKLFNHTKDFIVRFNFSKTPLGYSNNNEYRMPHIMLKKASDNSDLFTINLTRELAPLVSVTGKSVLDNWEGYYGDYGATSEKSMDYACLANYEWRYISGAMYFYVNDILKKTYSDQVTEDLKLTISTKSFDVINIKYIELAT